MDEISRNTYIMMSSEYSNWKGEWEDRKKFLNKVPKTSSDLFEVSPTLENLIGSVVNEILTKFGMKYNEYLTKLSEHEYIDRSFL